MTTRDTLRIDIELHESGAEATFAKIKTVTDKIRSTVGGAYQRMMWEFQYYSAAMLMISAIFAGIYKASDYLLKTASNAQWLSASGVKTAASIKALGDQFTFLTALFSNLLSKSPAFAAFLAYLHDGMERLKAAMLQHPELLERILTGLLLASKGMATLLTWVGHLALVLLEGAANSQALAGFFTLLGTVIPWLVANGLSLLEWITRTSQAFADFVANDTIALATLATTAGLLTAIGAAAKIAAIEIGAAAELPPIVAVNPLAAAAIALGLVCALVLELRSRWKDVNEAAERYRQLTNQPALPGQDDLLRAKIQLLEDYKKALDTVIVPNNGLEIPNLAAPTSQAAAIKDARTRVENALQKGNDYSFQNNEAAALATNAADIYANAKNLADAGQKMREEIRAYFVLKEAIAKELAYLTFILKESPGDPPKDALKTRAAEIAEALKETIKNFENYKYHTGKGFGQGLRPYAKELEAEEQAVIRLREAYAGLAAAKRAADNAVTENALRLEKQDTAYRKSAGWITDDDASRRDSATTTRELETKLAAAEDTAAAAEEKVARARETAKTQYDQLKRNFAAQFGAGKSPKLEYVNWYGPENDLTETLLANLKKLTEAHAKLAAAKQTRTLLEGKPANPITAPESLAKAVSTFVPAALSADGPAVSGDTASDITQLTAAAQNLLQATGDLKGATANVDIAQANVDANAKQPIDPVLLQKAREAYGPLSPDLRVQRANTIDQNASLLIGAGENKTDVKNWADSGKVDNRLQAINDRAANAAGPVGNAMGIDSSDYVDAQKKRIDEIVALTKAGTQKRVDAERWGAGEIAKLEQQTYQNRTKYAEQALDSYGSLTSQAADMFRQMYENSGRQQKKYWELSKKLSIASTIIDTASGAMKAFNSLANIPYVGFALGVAAAAAVVAMGAVKVSMIQQQQAPQAHAGTDYVGETQTALLKRGEIVLDPGTSDEVRDAVTGRSRREPTNYVEINQTIGPQADPNLAPWIAAAARAAAQQAVGEFIYNDRQTRNYIQNPRAR